MITQFRAAEILKPTEVRPRWNSFPYQSFRSETIPRIRPT